MDKQRRIAVFLAVLTALIWGLSFLSIKTAVAVLPPMTLGLARFVIASLILFLFLLVRKARPRLTRKDLPLMAATGFIGVTLYFLGENNGVMLLTASESSIIIGTIPVLTVLAERLFLKTRMGKAQYLGAILSAVGVTLIVAESMRLSSGPIGYLYMAGAALSWVVYAFLTKPLANRYSRLEVTFWHSLFGAIGFVPFVLFEKVPWERLNWLIGVQVLYLGIFCSALGYLFYIMVLQSLGASVSSVFLNLIPVVSVAASFLILGERLSGLQLAGGGVAIAGVYIANLTVNRAKAAAEGGTTG